MDTLNTSTTTYITLKIIFKFVLVIFILLVVLFYFKIDLLNFKIFKDNTLKQSKDFKPHETNRNLFNANTKDSYSSKKLNNFYIKSAYDCSKSDDQFSSIERLKTIISQGFRCLDFNLIYKDNNIFIKNQIKGESFLNALQVVDKHAFSNNYCSNHSDPIILNLRLDVDDNDIDHLQIVYNKLRDIFDYNDSKYILSNNNSLKHKFDDESRGDKNYYNSVLNVPISSLQKKIVICFNYDYRTAHTFDHNLLQYIHINTLFINENNISDFSTIDDASFFENHYILSPGASDSLLTELIDVNKTKLNMIIPKIYMDYMIINPTNIHDALGFSMRLMNFSSVTKFDEKYIQDDDLLLYLQNFDTNGYAFIVKPSNLL